MKKNKLTFLIAASFLALSAMVGCDSNEPSVESKAGVESDVTTSQLINPSSDGGNSQSSNGGNSSSNNSSSQGGGQQTKTDWTDAEKQTMSSHLYGLVLPFVEMDVTVKYEERQESVFILSTANMAAGFLASYAQKFTGWEGGDVSSEVGLSNGCVYAFQKAATVNGAKRYVSVMFAGVNVNSNGEPTGYNQTGKFYLQATDPYEYSFPKQFIDTWLQQQFGTNIGVPAFNADYYNLDQTGVLIAGSATNLEESYKATLLATNEFTIDPERNAQGYIVARPSDGKYVLLFKYDATNKVMILTVDAPRGWNAAAINAVFAKHNATAFDLPAINDQNITFGVDDTESGGVDWVTISAGGVTEQMVQDYINALKALNYKVMTIVEGSYIVNVFTNDGMYTLYLTYTPNSSPALLQIQFQLLMNTSVFKTWPAALIARYLDVETDVAPAFAGNAYGYSASINQGGYYRVVVHVDEGTENAAKDSYISTLTVDNGYTPDGYFMNTNIPQYKSANNQIHIAVSSDPTNFAGEINILMEAIAIVDTPWPTDEIAAAVSLLDASFAITDSIPYLDVSEASSCTVNTNFGSGFGNNIYMFEIDIDGLGSSMDAFIREFKLAGWSEDPYYGFDTPAGAYGALISPNNQMVAYFDTANNDKDLYIEVKPYHDQNYDEWPSNDLNQILNKWGIKNDILASFNSANFVEYDESSGEQKVEVLIYVGSSARQTALTDYCVALERIGYHFDENLGGHISNNHELLVKASIEDYGIKLTITNITIAYKVVGYNNDDWSFNNGLLMTDATNPEENYKVQYRAEFHADATSKFKILDSDGGWLGADNTDVAYDNSNNENFSKLENGDIQVNNAGTVTVYLKIYDDNSKAIWLEFAKDAPVLAPWPSDAVNANLAEWGVADEIPVLQDETISDINYVYVSEKVFTISVIGGASLVDDYEDLLEADYVYDNTLEKWLSTSSNVAISVHANGAELVITVILRDPAPVLNPWPADDISDFFGDQWTFPELDLVASYDNYVESDDPSKSVTINVTVISGNLDDAIAALNNDYGYGCYGANNVFTLSCDDMPTYTISSVTANGFVLTITVPETPVQDPVYKLVGSFSNWSYEDENSDELLKNDSPEEGYLAQYSIYFEIFAGEEFKIYDGSGDSGWIGGEVFQANEWFEVLSGGNIKAKQDGLVVLAFDILSDGTKKITINDFEPEFEDGTWAKARYEALQSNPDAYIPDLEIEGASEYVYNGGNGSIDISFSEGADLTNVGAALDAKLTAAGFHYSARFDGYVKVDANAIIGVGFNNDGTISIYPGTFDFTGDSGYGLVVFSYDDVDDYYYDDGEEVGELNASNEYVLTYYFDEGTWFIIYDFGEETKFEVTVDEYSGVVAGDFTDYFEYDMNNNMFRVKQSFEGTIYIKLSYGNDQIYVAIANPNP